MEPQFIIDFEQPSAVYTPGQAVRGTLTIRNQTVLNALSLKICIHGEVSTYWKKYEDKGKFSPHGHHHLKTALDFSDRNGRYYMASEHINYKSTVNILNGVSQPWSAIENTTNKIPSGVNIFPFVFQLPMSCPPSFEGTHGNVRYSVHVELSRPWRLDMENKRVFSVIPRVDLCTIPKAINPMTSHACKHSGFLGSKEVKIKVNLPKSGYTPGEVIPISLFIHNHSKKPVYSVKAQLIQHVHYTAQQENSHLFPDEHCHKHCDHKTAETVLYEMEQNFEVNCCANGEIQLALVLPNPLVPNFRTAIIEVDYCILVMVEKSKKLTCEFPIIIGTVPVGVPLGGRVVMRAPTYSTVQQEMSMTPEAPPLYQENSLASAPPEYVDNL